MPQPRQYPDPAAKQRACRARQEQARRDDLQAKGLPPAAPIPSLPSRAGYPRAGVLALQARARTALEAARDGMQAYHDDRSDAWQQGEGAAALQEHTNALDQILDDLDDLPPF